MRLISVSERALESLCVSIFLNQISQKLKCAPRWQGV